MGTIIKKNVIIVYKTTNIINGKYYIGVHKTNDIEDGYLGSGAILKKAIEKYGKENFRKDILSYHDSYESALEEEKNIVSEDLLSDENCYNVIIGGGMPPIRRGEDHHFFGKSHNKAKERMLSDANPSKGKFGENSNNYKKTVVYDENLCNIFISTDDPRYKNGEFTHVNKGFVTVKDSDGNFYRVSVNDPRILSGEFVHLSKGLTRNWSKEEICEKYKSRRGRKQTQEEIQKRKDSKPPYINETLTCPHCGKIGGKAGMLAWHFDNCRSKK